MSNLKKLILTLLLTSVMSFIILDITSEIFLPKWVKREDNRMTFIIKGFYQEKRNSLDVIITGNSDVYRGVSPMVMYNKYGITSYNLVSASERIFTGYTLQEEAYRLQNPKVMLFNVDEVYRGGQPSWGNASKIYDNLRPSIVKYKGIFFEKGYRKGMSIKLSHILPIVGFHDRYKELTSDDIKYSSALFTDYKNPTKGMDLVALNKPYSGDYMKYSKEKEEIPERSKYYLDKMIELSKKNNAQLVLFCIPTPDTWSYKKYNAIKEYAEENNLPYLDLNIHLKELGIDWSKDTVDRGDHLNIYGAEKVSNYLADYLHKNYDLPDRRKDKDYALWDEQYKEYLEIIKIEEEYAKSNKK